MSIKMNGKKSYEKELTDIKEFVESKYDFDLSDPRRDSYAVEARALYYMIALDTTEASLDSIGKLVMRTHASVINARKLFYYYKSIKKVKNNHRFYTNTASELVKSGIDWSSLELTENEIKYRLLTDGQRIIYDERASLILKSFDWVEVKDDYEIINCET